MKAFYFFFLALLFFASIEGAHAQVTYTSQACTPSSGNPFTSSSCWVRTGNCNSSLFPPNSGTTSCPIVIVVNNEMTIPSLSLGSNITLRVISGGKLTITGNLTQQASRISTVSLNGGELIVEGSLILLSGIGKDFTNDVLPTLTYVLIGMGIVQLIDNNFSQPIIFSKSTKSHPLEIFLVILASGTLFGVTGMIIAVPAYTALKVMAKEFFPNNKIVKALTRAL